MVVETEAAMRPFPLWAFQEKEILLERKLILLYINKTSPQYIVLMRECVRATDRYVEWSKEISLISLTRKNLPVRKIDGLRRTVMDKERREIIFIYLFYYIFIIKFKERKGEENKRKEICV